MIWAVGAFFHAKQPLEVVPPLPPFGPLRLSPLPHFSPLHGSRALFHPFAPFHPRSKMSTAEAATQGERTKYKALVKHMQESMWGALKKDKEVDDKTLTSLATIAKINKLVPTRPDRRFPNQNQLNNCW